LASLHPTV